MKNSNSEFHLIKAAAAVLASFTLLLAASCNAEYSGAEGDISTAECAILYTTDSDSRSQMDWLDGNLQKVGTSKYAFSGASLDGFANARMSDGRIILIPRGENMDRDYGKIVMIAPSNGQSTTMDINRINPTGYDAEGSVVVAASNLNYEFFVDAANTDTGEIRSVKTSDSGLNVTDVKLLSGLIFGSAPNDEGGCTICRIDINRKQCERIVEIPDDSTFMESHGSELVYITQGLLVKYDTQTKESTNLPLTRNDAFNLNIVGDTVLIAYTDIHDTEYKSLIEWRDYATGDVLYQAEHIGAIMQLETDGEKIYALGYDKLYQYEISNGRLILAKCISCEKNGYYLGGFYVLDK